MAECPAHPGNLVPGCRWCRAGITDDTKGRLVVRVADAVPGARTPARGRMMKVSEMVRGGRD